MTAHDPEGPLSPAGEARRQAILADALRAADGRRRTRAATRAAAGAAAAVFVVATFAFVVTRREPVPATVAKAPHPAPSPTTSPLPAPARPTVIVQVIREQDVRPKWEVLSDDQLIDALADAGRPSGLVTLNGETTVVPIR
jgi:hypothetical protein